MNPANQIILRKLILRDLILNNLILSKLILSNLILIILIFILSIQKKMTISRIKKVLTLLLFLAALSFYANYYHPYTWSIYFWNPLSSSSSSSSLIAGGCSISIPDAFDPAYARFFSYKDFKPPCPQNEAESPFEISAPDEFRLRTMVQSRKKKHRKNSHVIIFFPTSKRVSEVSEQANK